MSGLLNKLIVRILRMVFAGWSEGSITAQRTRQEKSARFFKLPKQVQSQAIDIGGVSSERLGYPDSCAGTILYLHGGAYALGSVNSHREMIARLVLSTKCAALAINYRLAPEHPYPAALEDTLSAYGWILSQGIDPSRIFLAGDSAGGGLAIAALLALRDTGTALPAGAFCFSPWLDLTLSGSSMNTKELLDPILSSSILKVYAGYYAGATKASDPLISPLYADLRNLPPIYLQSGENEILLDDSVRFYQKALETGVDVSLKTWEGMFHVFQLFSFLPETAESLKTVGNFINRLCHQGT